MTDLEALTKWAEGYRGGLGIGFVLGAVFGYLVGWLVHVHPRRRRRVVTGYAAPFGLHMTGDVVRWRPPTPEEEKDGVRRVVEEVRLTGFSIEHRDELDRARIPPGGKG